jgi:hypothetical protein
MARRVLQPDYDHLREAVLGAPRDGYLALLRKADPTDCGLELTYMPGQRPDGATLVGLVAKLYGVSLATHFQWPR